MRDIYDENDYSFMNKPPSTPEPVSASDEIAPFEEPMNKPSIPAPTQVPMSPNKLSMIDMGLVKTISLVGLSLTVYRAYLAIYGNGTCDFKESARD